MVCVFGRCVVHRRIERFKIKNLVLSFAYWTSYVVRIRSSFKSFDLCRSIFIVRFVATEVSRSFERRFFAKCFFSSICVEHKEKMRDLSGNALGFFWSIHQILKQSRYDILYFSLSRKAFSSLVSIYYLLARFLIKDCARNRKNMLNDRYSRIL